MKKYQARRDPYRIVRARRRIILGLWLMAGLVVIARAAEVQVAERAEWRREALRQHQKSQNIPAPRGRILDRDLGELAVTHKRVEVGIAPNEIQDPEAAAAALAEAVEIPLAQARRMVSSDRAWVVVRGRYSTTRVASLRGIRGIHLDTQLERLYPRDELARGLLGRVADESGKGGVEQSMDTLLAGRPGLQIVARDNLGRPIPGQVVPVEPPAPGHDVVLTVDIDLQEIAQEILLAAVDSAGARGGDLVVTRPATGEVLALVSVANGSTSALSAINTPYEPGSTIKPITAAGLLRHDLVTLRDSVDTEEGRWTVQGRTVHDVVRGGGWKTLETIIQQSSNVGIAKFAQRFSDAQQYENLRDFGFGTPTGIPLPGEASGTLRRPELWSGQSKVSLSIGYELGVTPIQMAMAFGAIANGGDLMEPWLVREIRSSTGDLVFQGGPRRVRRVVPVEVTEALTPILVGVVEEGSGSRARMVSYRVAGKSGTARATGASGTYEKNMYYSSFAAFFPAEDPQLLFFVKLDRPKGAYYGGATAAPITRTTVEALLAAGQSPIDRQALLDDTRDRRPAPPLQPLVQFASIEGDLPVRGAADPPAQSEPSRVLIPQLTGAPLRTAVRRLHELGLRVELDGSGAVQRTVPGSGRWLQPGDTIRLIGKEHTR